jgi:ubiquinone/menaquinone biosynthesis C-methylase UbiE
MTDLYERQKRYYDLRSREYDATSWDFDDEETKAILAIVAVLPAARTLDIACGTGSISRYLRGDVTLLDASAEMLGIASTQVPDARTVRADALDLPFEDETFERVSCSHFLGHLRSYERKQFLVGARRVARELIVIEERGNGDEGIERRTLVDGSEHDIWKVRWSTDALLAELGRS